MRRLASGAGVGFAVLFSLSCGSPTTTSDVYAASSLTELFQALGEAFSEEHDDVDLRFNFASSSTLATQIRQGAPADLFASANPAIVESLHSEGYLGDSKLLATTNMVVVVRHDDSVVYSLEDLAKPGLILVLAAEGVPAGDYAREVLTLASGSNPTFLEDVLANVRSHEPNVRAALLKVELGEADATIVYSTDVSRDTDAVRIVEIPAQDNVTARYAVALVHEPDASARAFYAFLDSGAALAIIRQFGFSPVRGQE